jgi:tRNA A-37 threonylcarbamoyl transferase component Bud32
MELAPGNVIGNYEIIKTIAQGGMGMVYLARHRFIQREVALKVLFPKLTSDKEFTLRFQREGQEMAQLRHPNIVEVYDASVADGVYYLAIEYLPGGTLQQQLTSLHNANLIMPVDQALQITRQVASALDYIHSKGLVHRDIKPSNILLAQDGRYVLADFGIVYDESATTKLTRNLTTMGTPEYMSPEQAQGLKIDGRSDIYSLGIVLYEMLAGKPPFTADTPWGTVYKHIKDPPPPITLSRIDLPGPAIDIVNKAIAKNPADRFQTGREFAAAIDKVLGQPVKVMAAATGAGMSRGLLIGGVVVSLAMIIGAVILVATILLGSNNAGAPGTATQIANVTAAATARVTRSARATTTASAGESTAILSEVATVTAAPDAATTPNLAYLPVLRNDSAVAAKATPSKTTSKQTTPTPVIAQKTATATPQSSVDFTLRNYTVGREQWGKPTSADGCSNFNNDNVGLWFKYQINFEIANTGPSDITQWTPVFISSIKNVLPTCVDLTGSATIAAGSSTHVAYTLYMSGQYLQTIEVSTSSTTKRLCLDPSGRSITPC